MRLEGQHQRKWSAWSRMIVVAVAMIILELSNSAKWLSASIEWMVNPVTKVTQTVKVERDRVVRQIKFYRVGALRIIDLEREVAELSASVSRLAALEKENKQLKEQLNILPSGNKYVDLEVVSVAKDVILVRSGGGIMREGSVVVWGDNLVGRVESVGWNNGIVSRLRKFDEGLSVKVITVSGVEIGEGVVMGDEIEGLVVDQVQGEFELSSGMIVVTRSTEDMIGGLVVGKIGKIISSDSDVYQTASVEVQYEPNIGDIIFMIEEFE